MPTGSPFYETPEALEEACDRYFIDCKEENRPITITGLALALGFADRQSLYDYNERPGFSCIIKKARFRVENAYEEKLSGNSVAGPIFALKNIGTKGNWSDKQEVEHTGKYGGPIQFGKIEWEIVVTEPKNTNG